MNMYFFLAALAILPVILLLIFIYKMDSYEKEPIGLLVRLVVFGIVSAVPAIILEELGTLLINNILGTPPVGFAPSNLYNFINTFFIIAISEECCKFLVAFFNTWKHPAFNFKFDGIVYCFYASMGFALIENLLYVFGSNIAIGTAIARALLAIPAHGMFSVFMGYYYGEAKFCHATGNKSGIAANLARGFVIAVTLHGFYDFCLFSGKLIMLIPFLIFVIIADVYTIIKIRKASKKNQAIYNTPAYQPYWVSTPAYAAGGGQMPLINPVYGGVNPQYNGYTTHNQNLTYNAGAAGNNYQTYNTGAAGNNQAYNTGAPGNTNQTYNAGAPGNAYQAIRPLNQGENDNNRNPAPQYDNTAAASAENYSIESLNGTPSYSEQQTSILRREPPRMIYCPNCHNVCNFNSFYCGICYTPLHNIGVSQ